MRARRDGTARPTGAGATVRACVTVCLRVLQVLFLVPATSSVCCFCLCSWQLFLLLLPAPFCPLLALSCLSFSFLSAFCLGIGIDSGCGRINDLARGACGVLLDSSSSSQQQPSNRNNNTHSHTYREREKKGHSALPALSSFPLCPSKLRQLLLGSSSCLQSPPSRVFRLGLISSSFFGFSFVWISSSFVVRFNLITIYVWKFLNCLCNPSKLGVPRYPLQQ